MLCFMQTFMVHAQERRMVDVGGHRLEVLMMKGGGVPIIFEAGAGEDLSSWEPIFDQVGSFAQAIAYSRAGHGKSEMSQTPRTTEMIYQDYQVLMDSLSVEDPVILVGHSRGGFLVRYYTTQRPDWVGGLVIIDGYHEESSLRLLKFDSLIWAEEHENMREMMRMAKSGEYDVPEGAIAEAEENIMNRLVIRGGEEIPELPDIPVAVLTSLKHPGYSQERLGLIKELQAEWTANKTNQVWLVTNQYGHHIHQEQPALVVALIRYIHDLVLARKIGE